MEYPLVSIVLCTFNGEKYLQQQLNSLAAQTYTNIQFVISDNESTDNTVAIIKAWTGNKTNIIFCNTKAKGLNKNFFTALQKATGEYIFFCDQDDVWMPEKVESLIAFYQQHPQAAMVYCLSKKFTEVVPETNSVKKHLNYLEGSKVRKTLLTSFTLGHNLCLKKSTVARLPVPDNEVVAYDWWITVSCLCMGGVKCLPQVLTFWRQHNANTTKTLIAGSFYQNTIKTLQQFLQHPLIKTPDKNWIKQAIKQFQKLNNTTFSFSLFLFLLSNANTLFFYKTKNNVLLKWISYSKWCFKMSKKNYQVIN